MASYFSWFRFGMAKESELMGILL